MGTRNDGSRFISHNFLSGNEKIKCIGLGVARPLTLGRGDGEVDPSGY